MQLSLDTILTSAIVITAIAYIARPWIARLPRRKSGSSTVCHSESIGTCGGRCPTCPVKHVKPKGV